MEQGLLSNTNVAASKKVFVEYNPNDFFYVIASNEYPIPDQTTCSNLNVRDKSWDISCNSSNFETNQEQCMQKELCANIENATSIKSLQNKHSGSDENYANTDVEYRAVVLNTINLGIGTLLLGFMIFKNLTPN